MFKLHGLPVSNYYNVAKLGLLEKDIPFEEVMAQPSQEPDFLAISPMGKIPVLEHESVFLSESKAILAFLERFKAEPSHFPADPIQAGRAQQIHDFIDLYVDSPARTLLGAAFFGRETTPEQIEEVSQNTAKGVAALKRVAVFEPYIAGSSLSHADFAAFLTLPLAREILTRLNAPDPLADWPELDAYLQRLGEKPNFKRVVDERHAALTRILAQQGA